MFRKFTSIDKTQFAEDICLSDLLASQSTDDQLVAEEYTGSFRHWLIIMRYLRLGV